ncbi:MAG: sensor histidine kinase [Rubrivivax sp.]
MTHQTLQRSVDRCAVPSALQSAAALGDTLALIDAARRRLSWASPAWLAHHAGLDAGAALDDVERALPGAAAAVDAAEVLARDVALGGAGEWEARVVRLADSGVLLRLRDRSEAGRALQRQLDDRERLLFTSRVISVGEMATTLAHELNQPIGAAANLLRGLRARVARRRALLAPEAVALDRCIDQVMFASRVIARMREFTHSHQPRHARVDLVALLRASASLLDWDVRRTHASLALDVPDGGVVVRGDEVMLQQVVVNLVRNALDALRSSPPTAPRIEMSLELGARDVELRVRDNGCGLGDAAAANLFVPFASTKPNGMGIGLSICRSFIELHQGRLWFTRNADCGATFHVSLPLMPPAVAAATDPENPS